MPETRRMEPQCTLVIYKDGQARRESHLGSYEQALDEAFEEVAYWGAEKVDVFDDSESSDVPFKTVTHDYIEEHVPKAIRALALRSVRSRVTARGRRMDEERKAEALT